MGNLYSILGLKSTATPVEIKKAYRVLAQKYHPDKPGGDEDKFNLIRDAYEVLSNPERRKHYDETGEVNESVNTIEHEATGMMVHVFQRMLDKHDFAGRDYVSLVEKDIAQSRAMLTNEVHKREKKIEKISALMPKITCKESENVLTGSLMTMIGELENQVAAGKHQIEVHSIALEKIRLYGFEGIELSNGSASVGFGGSQDRDFGILAGFNKYRDRE